MINKNILLQKIDFALNYSKEKLNSGTEFPFLYKHCFDKLNLIKKDVIEKGFSNQAVSLGQFAIKRMDSRDIFFTEKLCDIATQIQNITNLKVGE